MAEDEQGYRKDIFSFFDYCVEFGYIKRDCTDDFNKIPLHWGDYGGEYIEFCKEHGFASENLDEL